MTITRALTGCLATAGLACAALTPVGTAAAAAPERYDIDESYSFLAEDYCDIEGFDVQIDGTLTGRLMIHDRQGLEYWTSHEAWYETHSYGDNQVTVEGHALWKDLTVEDLGDTLRITVLGTGPESTYGPDGKAIARNPGQFRFQVLIDEATGEELSFEVLKESTGRNDDFCAIVPPLLQG